MYKIFQNKDHEGFSLAELLVVVAILAILAAIAIPLFLNQKKKAADGVVRSDLHNVGIDLASLYTGTVTTITGSDGTLSPNLTVDGMTVDKKGARVYANNTGQWCVSKISTSGNIFAITSTNRSVYEATSNCTSPSTQPAGGTTGGGTVVSAEGNLLTTNQALFSDGNTTGWNPGGSLNCSLAAQSGVTGSPSTYVMAATTTARSYDDWYPASTTVLGVTGGQPMTFSARMRAATVARNVNFRIVWYNDLNVNVGETLGPATADTTTGWTSLSYQVTPPVAATRAIIRFDVLDASRAVGEVHYFTNVGMWTGTGGQWAPPGQPIYQ